MKSLPVPSCRRPRVEGLREAEILQQTAELLARSGYDRLTLDAVAGAAHVSKATLYRRWAGKAELVLDAITHVTSTVPAREVDTGSLRGDLLDLSCCLGGLTDDLRLGLLGAVASALRSDAALFAAASARLTAPLQDAALQAFVVAQQRGEVAAGADLELLSRILPALAMHQTFVVGEPLTPERVAYLVDTVVLPACRPAPVGQPA